MDFHYDYTNLLENYSLLKKTPLKIFNIITTVLENNTLMFLEDLIYLNHKIIEYTTYFLRKKSDYKFFIEFYIEKYDTIVKYDFLNRWFLNCINFNIEQYYDHIISNKLVYLYHILLIDKIKVKNNVNDIYNLLFSIPLDSPRYLYYFFKRNRISTKILFNSIVRLLNISDKFYNVMVLFKNIPNHVFLRLVHYRDRKRNNILHKLIYSWFQKKYVGYKNFFKIFKYINQINPSLITHTNKRHMSPIYYIFEHKKFVLDIFLKNMNPYLKENNYQDDLGNGLLHYIKYVKQINMLFQYFELSDFPLVNKKEQNPLHTVSFKKINHNDKFQTINKLISLKIDYKKKDNDGIAPIDNFGKAIIKRLNID